MLKCLNEVIFGIDKDDLEKIAFEVNKELETNKYILVNQNISNVPKTNLRLKTLGINGIIHENNPVYIEYYNHNEADNNYIKNCVDDDEDYPHEEPSEYGMYDEKEEVGPYGGAFSSYESYYRWRFGV